MGIISHNDNALSSPCLTANRFKSFLSLRAGERPSAEDSNEEWDEYVGRLRFAYRLYQVKFGSLEMRINEGFRKRLTTTSIAALEWIQSRLDVPTGEAVGVLKWFDERGFSTRFTSIENVDHHFAETVLARWVIEKGRIESVLETVRSELSEQQQNYYNTWYDLLTLAREQASAIILDAFLGAKSGGNARNLKEHLTSDGYEGDASLGWLFDYALSLADNIPTAENAFDRAGNYPTQGIADLSVGLLALESEIDCVERLREIPPAPEAACIPSTMRAETFHATQHARDEIDEAVERRQRSAVLRAWSMMTPDEQAEFIVNHPDVALAYGLSVDIAPVVEAIEESLQVVLGRFGLGGSSEGAEEGADLLDAAIGREAMREREVRSVRANADYDVDGDGIISGWERDEADDLEWLDYSTGGLRVTLRSKTSCGVADGLGIPTH